MTGDPGPLTCPRCCTADSVESTTMGGLLLDGVAHYETDPNRATCRRCRYSGNAGDWRIIARLRPSRDPDLLTAALGALLAFRRWEAESLLMSTTGHRGAMPDWDGFKLAMDALQEALAK